MPKPVYSLVIPLFNEEAVLPLLLERLDALLDRLDGAGEVVFVDDGSRDATGLIAARRAASDPRYRYLALSRNFGHQIAITAGMEHAAGDAVVVMDADLQDPPEVVLELAAKWREGFDIVCASRLSREGESRFKLWSASLFYAVIRKLTAVDIPANVGDFRLIDRKAVNAFRSMPERDRFVRGMFSWMGFSQTCVSFHRASRKAGRSHYGWSKMIKLAGDGIVGFSDVPLRLALWLGAFVSLAALTYGGWATIMELLGAHFVSGWASTIALVSLLAGLNLLMTGLVGVYVGRIHTEVKGRPLFVVARKVGFANADVGALPEVHRLQDTLKTELAA